MKITRTAGLPWRRVAEAMGEEENVRWGRRREDEAMGPAKAGCCTASRPNEADSEPSDLEILMVDVRWL